MYNDFMCERNPAVGDRTLVDRNAVCTKIVTKQVQVTMTDEEGKAVPTGVTQEVTEVVPRNDQYVAQARLDGVWKNLHFGETLQECIEYLRDYCPATGYSADTRIKDRKGVIQ